MAGVNTAFGQEFQFHKGTIRTQILLAHGGRCWTFQFHKGTIRTYLLCNKQDAYTTISIP